MGLVTVKVVQHRLGPERSVGGRVVAWVGGSASHVWLTVKRQRTGQEEDQLPHLLDLILPKVGTTRIRTERNAKPSAVARDPRTTLQYSIRIRET